MWKVPFKKRKEKYMTRSFIKWHFFCSLHHCETTQICVIYQFKPTLLYNSRLLHQKKWICVNELHTVTFLVHPFQQLSTSTLTMSCIGILTFWTNFLTLNQRNNLIKIKNRDNMYVNTHGRDFNYFFFNFHLKRSECFTFNELKCNTKGSLDLWGTQSQYPVTLK